MNRLLTITIGLFLITSCSSDEEKDTEVSYNSLEVEESHLAVHEDATEHYRWPAIKTHGDEMLEEVERLLSYEMIVGESMDSTRAMFNECHCGLMGTDYLVNYNENGLFDIAFELIYNYNEREIIHESYCVWIEKGTYLLHRELLDTDVCGPLVSMCNAQLQENIATALGDLSEEEDMALSYLYEGHEFTADNLRSFSLNEKGVNFIYSFMFPRSARILQPDGTIFISFDDLKPFLNPEGPLGHLAANPA